MVELRPWALFRRLQYGSVYFLILALIAVVIYFVTPKEQITCFDGMQNGEERGVDCGGGCVRICAADVVPPVVTWAESFKIIDGQYNAVAYVRNPNELAATPNMRYTFQLLDDSGGVVAERSGSTVLPPNSTYPIFEGRIDTGLDEAVETKIELEMAELWLPAEVGRNQFRTVDLQLIGADERPRLNVEMENTELTEAQDVEVVATLFDAAGRPLTASQTFVEYFPPRSTSDLVFTWQLPISTTVRSCDVPTDIVVAIDLSGSMNNDQANPPEPITSVLDSAVNFVDNLRSSDQASLVTFASDALVNQNLTDDIGLIKSRMKQLTIDPAEESGSTNIGDALLAAQSELNSVRHNTDARNVVVLLTDGLATAPDEEPEKYAIEAAGKLLEDNVVVYTIGLGFEVNMQFLRDIAADESKAYSAITTSELEQIYNMITTAICEDGTARIDVIPKTDANFAPLR